MTSKTDFLIAYGKVIAQSWDGPAYRDRLFADPVAALNEAGLTVPEGVKVDVVEFALTTAAGDAPAREDGLDILYRDWVKAAETGTYTLSLPTSPPDVGDMVLYDQELEGVAGGGILDYCCCCCC